MAIDVESLKQKLNKENGLKLAGVLRSGCQKGADRVVRLWKSGRNGKIACVSGAILLLVFLKSCLFSSDDYEDPVAFFEKVAKDEMASRPEYYAEYGIKEIQVADAILGNTEEDGQWVKARVRFIPRSGIKYYQWINFCTEGIAWIGIFPCEPFNKQFAGDIEKANRLVKEWNEYRVGLFREIKSDVREKLLTLDTSALRKKQDGIYIVDKSFWNPFNSLDFGYYYTQHTARNRDNCPALLCDDNGPISRSGKMFVKDYRETFDRLVKARKELDDATRKISEKNLVTVNRFKVALEKFIQIAASMPKLVE